MVPPMHWDIQNIRTYTISLERWDIQMNWPNIVLPLDWDIQIHREQLPLKKHAFPSSTEVWDSHTFMEVRHNIANTQTEALSHTGISRLRDIP